MKKVLVYIDWYLPGYKAGGPIRSMANMIAKLKDSYSFYVVTRNSDYLETVSYENTKPDEWNQLSENENVYYINEQSLSIFTLRRLIKSINYDIIYINGVYSFYFSILPIILAKRLNLSKIIVAPRGMLSYQAFSAKKLKKKIFVSFARIFGLYTKTILHVTSNTEKSDIESLNLKSKHILLHPNFAPPIQNYYSKRQKIAHELKLVSIARVSPEKNTLFALECLAHSKYKGNITYHIYGSIYNKEYWNQCQETISRMPSNVKVVYLGDINNNKVIETLNEYDFLFLPSKGENFGHSILESFIAGCPVIISNTTPWKNLEEKKLGWDISLEKDLFVKTIQNAIEFNHENYQILSESCREFALKITENSELKDAYIKMFG